MLQFLANWMKRTESRAFTITSMGLEGKRVLDLTDESAYRISVEFGHRVCAVCCVHF
jgi:hypothetical protein